jgi:hypothetical protein
LVEAGTMTIGFNCLLGNWLFLSATFLLKRKAKNSKRKPLANLSIPKSQARASLETITVATIPSA